MKSVIFSVFLLFLLPVVLADKNTCYSCNATNSHTCKHEEEECPEGNECMIISEEIIIQGKSCHSLTKRCALNLPCNQTFYGNVGLDIIIKVSHRCCEGKLCNTDPFEPPSIPTKGKGIKCPSCFLYNNTGDCTATQSTICSGKEDQCMEFRGSMKLPCGGNVDYSGQGCGSKGLCEFGASVLVGLSVTKQLEIKCYLPKMSI